MAQVRAPQSAHGDERVLRLEPPPLRHWARHRVRFVAQDQNPQLAQVEGTALRCVGVQPKEPRGEQSAATARPSRPVLTLLLRGGRRRPSSSRPELATPYSCDATLPRGAAGCGRGSAGDGRGVAGGWQGSEHEARGAPTVRTRVAAVASPPFGRDTCEIRARYVRDTGEPTFRARYVRDTCEIRASPPFGRDTCEIRARYGRAHLSGETMKRIAQSRLADCGVPDNEHVGFGREQRLAAARSCRPRPHCRGESPHHMTVRWCGANESARNRRSARK
jgi:hypothetical protein